MTNPRKREARVTKGDRAKVFQSAREITQEAREREPVREKRETEGAKLIESETNEESSERGVEMARAARMGKRLVLVKFMPSSVEVLLWRMTTGYVGSDNRAKIQLGPDVFLNAEGVRVPSVG